MMRFRDDAERFVGPCVYCGRALSSMTEAVAREDSLVCFEHEAVPRVCIRRGCGREAAGERYAGQEGLACPRHGGYSNPKWRVRSTLFKPSLVSNAKRIVRAD